MEVEILFWNSFQESKFINIKILKFPKASLIYPTGSYIYNNGWYRWQSVNNGLGAQNARVINFFNNNKKL
jgi:hypothetical protein